MHTADCGIRTGREFRKTYILTLRQIQQISRRQWMVYKSPDIVCGLLTLTAEYFKSGIPDTLHYSRYSYHSSSVFSKPTDWNII